VSWGILQMKEKLVFFNFYIQSKITFTNSCDQFLDLLDLLDWSLIIIMLLKIFEKLP